MRLATLAFVSGCASVATGTAPTPDWVADTSSFTPKAGGTVSLAAQYGDVAAKIIAAARADHGGFDKLSILTDTIGNRLAGSASLDRAIGWAVQAFKDDGFDAKTEKVMVPHWVRNHEEASLVAPVARSLTMLGLGGSIGTPDGGIAAQAIVVHSWDELERRKAEVLGKIVVYNVPMPAWSTEHGSGYSETVQYRTNGASRAAKYGAVAVLVRSVTATSLATVHTGAMAYDKDQPKIPAASITVEDTELLDRLALQGKALQIRLSMGAQMLADAESANVIAEIRGRELPDEIVLLAAHIDSWDVGQGAHDDGAGVVTMMQALHTLKSLNLTPRRTIRVVLFTNEENGLRGGKTYAADHASELAHHVAALESDSGGFAPTGFGVEHVDPASADHTIARLTELASLLSTGDLHATRVRPNGGGADISPLKPVGVPQISLDVDNRTYFDYHHTRADTLDKVSAQSLADMSAVAAVFAYVVADMPDRLDAPLPTTLGRNPYKTSGAPLATAPPATSSSPALTSNPYETRAPSPAATSAHNLGSGHNLYNLHVTPQVVNVVPRPQVVSDAVAQPTPSSIRRATRK